MENSIINAINKPTPIYFQVCNIKLKKDGDCFYRWNKEEAKWKELNYETLLSSFLIEHIFNQHIGINMCIDMIKQLHTGYNNEKCNITDCYICNSFIPSIKQITNY